MVCAVECSACAPQCLRASDTSTRTLWNQWMLGYTAIDDWPLSVCSSALMVRAIWSKSKFVVDECTTVAWVADRPTTLSADSWALEHSIGVSQYEEFLCVQVRIFTGTLSITNTYHVSPDESCTTHFRDVAEVPGRARRSRRGLSEGL